MTWKINQRFIHTRSRIYEWKQGGNEQEQQFSITQPKWERESSSVLCQSLCFFLFGERIFAREQHDWRTTGSSRSSSSSNNSVAIEICDRRHTKARFLSKSNTMNFSGMSIVSLNLPSFARTLPPEEEKKNWQLFLVYVSFANRIQIWYSNRRP